MIVGDDIDTADVSAGLANGCGQSAQAAGGIGEKDAEEKRHGDPCTRRAT